MLINFAFIAVLWNLWFFSFWSVSIVADAAHSSFGRSALIAGFNAGAGILGFPIGGWLSDVAVRRGIGRSAWSWSSPRCSACSRSPSAS
jgi:MFS transporter, ACS family, D-galactonate transporter